MDWEDCKKNQVWDIDKKACIRLNTKMIGDGKLPNRYWISIHEDYYINRGGSLDWASEVKKLKTNSRTVAISNKYHKAKEFIVNEFIQYAVDKNARGDKEKIFGLAPKGITIEDRLSGELYDYTLEEVSKLEAFEREDIRFTKEELGKKGIAFV
jgi:hypothetical protein